jgi:hypothetical protein
MCRYNMIFEGSLDDFISATGMNPKPSEPENFKRAVDILFERYVEKWADRRGIKSCRGELYTGEGQKSDVISLFEDIDKLPENPAVFAKICVDNKEYISDIVGDMSSKMGLDIEYCDIPMDK